MRIIPRLDQAKIVRLIREYMEARVTWSFTRFMWIPAHNRITQHDDVDTPYRAEPIIKSAFDPFIEFPL